VDNFIATSINELKFDYENEVEELVKDIEFNCQIELPEINDDNDIWFNLSDSKRFSCGCHMLNLVLQKAIKRPRLDINIYQREFCYFLVSFFFLKFDTELKPDIYRVSKFDRFSRFFLELFNYYF